MLTIFATVKVHQFRHTHTHMHTHTTSFLSHTVATYLTTLLLERGEGYDYSVVTEWG